MSSIGQINVFQINNSGQNFVNSGQNRNAGLNLTKIKEIHVKYNIIFI